MGQNAAFNMSDEIWLCVPLVGYSFSHPNIFYMQLHNTPQHDACKNLCRNSLLKNTRCGQQRHIAHMYNSPDYSSAGIDTLHCYKPNHAPIAPQTTSQRFAAVHAHRRLEQ